MLHDTVYLVVDRMKSGLFKVAVAGILVWGLWPGNLGAEIPSWIYGRSAGRGPVRLSPTS